MILSMLGGVLPHGTITITIGGTILLFCEVTAFLPLSLDCLNFDLLGLSTDGPWV